MAAHPRAALIEQAARDVMVAMGRNPDRTIIHAIDAEWDPNVTDTPKEPRGGTEKQSPEWQLHTRAVLYYLTVFEAFDAARAVRP